MKIPTPIDRTATMAMTIIAVGMFVHLPFFLDRFIISRGNRCIRLAVFRVFDEHADTDGCNGNEDKDCGHLFSSFLFRVMLHGIGARSVHLFTLDYVNYTNKWLAFSHTKYSSSYF